MCQNKVHWSEKCLQKMNLILALDCNSIRANLTLRGRKLAVLWPLNLPKFRLAARYFESKSSTKIFRVFKGNLFYGGSLILENSQSKILDHFSRNLTCRTVPSTQIHSEFSFLSKRPIHGCALGTRPFLTKLFSSSSLITTKWAPYNSHAAFAWCQVRAWKRSKFNLAGSKGLNRYELRYFPIISLNL